MTREEVADLLATVQADLADVLNPFASVEAHTAFEWMRAYAAAAVARHQLPLAAESDADRVVAAKGAAAT